MNNSEKTALVVRRHTENVRKWDMSAIAGDYTVDAVMISPDIKAIGREAIMAAFARSPPATGLVIESEAYEGNSGLIVYHTNAFAFASDSFVVREGLIAAQTVVVGAKQGARIVAQAWADHLKAGRGMEAVALLADDVHYVIIGSTPLSGSYDGYDDVIKRLVPIMARFPQPPQVSCDTVIADGDQAVVLGSGLGEGPYGPYNQAHYAYVMRVVENRIVELVEYLDTALVEVAGFGTQMIRTGIRI